MAPKNAAANKIPKAALKEAAKAAAKEAVTEMQRTMGWPPPPPPVKPGAAGAAGERGGRRDGGGGCGGARPSYWGQNKKGSRPWTLCPNEECTGGKDGSRWWVWDDRLSEFGFLCPKCGGRIGQNLALRPPQSAEPTETAWRRELKERFGVEIMP